MAMVLCIKIDGMLSGTGIRDTVKGGYIAASEIGVSADLVRQIDDWLAAYADQHYAGFADDAIVSGLDATGVKLAKLIKAELPEAEVGYFSNAKMRDIPL